MSFNQLAKFGGWLAQFGDCLIELCDHNLVQSIKSSENERTIRSKMCSKQKARELFEGAKSTTTRIQILDLSTTNIDCMHSLIRLFAHFITQLNFAVISSNISPFRIGASSLWLSSMRVGCVLSNAAVNAFVRVELAPKFNFSRTTRLH